MLYLFTKLHGVTTHEAMLIFATVRNITLFEKMLEIFSSLLRSGLNPHAFPFIVPTIFINELDLTEEGIKFEYLCRVPLVSSHGYSYPRMYAFVCVCAFFFFERVNLLKKGR